MRIAKFSAIVSAAVLLLHPVVSFAQAPQPYGMADGRIAVTVDCGNSLFASGNCGRDSDSNRALLVKVVSESLSRLGFDAVPAGKGVPNTLSLTVIGIADEGDGSVQASASAAFLLADTTGPVAVGTFKASAADTQSSLAKLADEIGNAMIVLPAAKDIFFPPSKPAPSIAAAGSPGNGAQAWQAGWYATYGYTDADDRLVLVGGPYPTRYDCIVAPPRAGDTEAEDDRSCYDFETPPQPIPGDCTAVVGGPPC